MYHGASRTCVGPDFVRKLKLKINKFKGQPLLTASGTRMPVKGEVETNIHLLVDGFIYESTFNPAALREMVPDADIILGKTS